MINQNLFNNYPKYQAETWRSQLTGREEKKRSTRGLMEPQRPAVQTSVEVQVKLAPKMKEVFVAKDLGEANDERILKQRIRQELAEFPQHYAFAF